MHTQLEAAFELQFARKIAELEHKGHSCDTTEQDACLMLASSPVIKAEVPLLCRGCIFAFSCSARSQQCMRTRAIERELNLTSCGAS